MMLCPISYHICLLYFSFTVCLGVMSETAINRNGHNYGLQSRDPESHVARRFLNPEILRLAKLLTEI